MYHKSSTYKKAWFTLIKIAIITGAGYYIYRRLILYPKVDMRTLGKYISTGDVILYTGLMIGFSTMNWLLEGRKWQILARSLTPVSFKEALKQSLSAHVPALITPLKSGEFGGKMWYYPAPLRKKIAGRIFLGNAWQLITTLTFGIVGFGGLLFYQGTIPIPFPRRRFLYSFIILLTGILAGSTLLKPKGSLYKVFKSFSYKPEEPLNRQVAFYSFLRYLIFSHQYYFTLKYLEFETGYMESMSLIFSLYLIATFIPVMSVFDLVIKGSIALMIFGPVEDDDIKILVASTLMWLFNYILPVLPGSLLFVSKKTPPTINPETKCS
jgi:hypothetical protein